MRDKTFYKVYAGTLVFGPCAILKFIVFLFVTFFVPCLVNALQVFPDAEGYGTSWSIADWADTTPDIYKIDTLTATTALSEDSDEGAYKVYSGGFCKALTQHDNNGNSSIIIFEVGGVIDMSSCAEADLAIYGSELMVFGSSAPSPGITLTQNTSTKAELIRIHSSYVLFENIRFRAHMSDDFCGIDMDVLNIQHASSSPANMGNIVMDHVSLAFAVDETGEVYDLVNDAGSANEPNNVTYSNSIIGAPLDNSCHPEGRHGTGILQANTNGYIGWIKNLFIFNPNRNPVVTQPYGAGSAKVYSLNNAIHGSGDGVNRNPLSLSENNAGYDDIILATVIGGVQSQGSSRTETDYLHLDDGVEAGSEIYYSDLICVDGTDADCVSTDVGTSFIVGAATLTPPSPAPDVLAASAVKAYLVANVGAWPKNRDSLDTALVAHFNADTGSYEDTIADYGGFPTLTPSSRALTIPGSPYSTSVTGYTNLEDWLHDYKDTVEGTAVPAVPANAIQGVDIQ